MSARVTVDVEHGVGYIKLHDGQVDRTIESGGSFDDGLLVDIDDLGIVIGVEILDLNRSFEAEQIFAVAHVRSEDQEALRRALVMISRGRLSSGSARKSSPLVLRTTDGRCLEAC